MLRLSPSAVQASAKPRKASLHAFCLAFAITSFLAGCGVSSEKQQQAADAKQTPQAEFEWGMERLDRALQMSKPSSADGLFTKRKMTHELFPPDENNESFTAKVTITTESSFIHGKRKVTKADNSKTASDGEPEIFDPLADKSEELNKVVDIPGVGADAQRGATATVETRSLDKEAVFDMAYLDDKWKLISEPEHKYEQLWFEYAFPE